MSQGLIFTSWSPVQQIGINTRQGRAMVVTEDVKQTATVNIAMVANLGRNRTVCGSASQHLQPESPTGWCRSGQVSDGSQIAVEPRVDCKDSTVQIHIMLHWKSEILQQLHDSDHKFLNIPALCNARSRNLNNLQSRSEPLQCGPPHLQSAKVWNHSCQACPSPRHLQSKCRLLRVHFGPQGAKLYSHFPVSIL